MLSCYYIDCKLVIIVNSVVVFFSAILFIVGVAISKVAEISTFSLTSYSEVQQNMNLFISFGDGFLVSGANGLGVLTTHNVESLGRVVSIWEVLCAVLLTSLFLVVLAKKTESLFGESKEKEGLN